MFWHAQQNKPLYYSVHSKNKLLLVIKAACLSVLMKFVTRTCRKIFNRFTAVVAYLNRPVWTLLRCFPGHCKIPARDGWKWRSGSVPASRILWTLRERALCCLYRRKSETSALINIGDPNVATCSFWTYIRRYIGKPSHMGILLIKKT